MGVKIDRIGERHGSLTIIDELEPNPRRKTKARLFLVRCDCGKEMKWEIGRFQRNVSCGCKGTPWKKRRTTIPREKFVKIVQQRRKEWLSRPFIEDVY